MKKIKDIVLIIFVLILSVLVFSCGEKTTKPKETQVETPTFSPEAGTYEEAQDVTISCSTEGATILYTTDGSAPDATSLVYSAPIRVDSDITITAQAFKDGWIASDVANVSYVIIITLPTVATPIFSLEEGSYDSPQSVTISCATEGAEIRYTTDGSNPTSSSPIYSEEIKVSETTTIKAIAFKEDWNDSDIASATYTIIPIQQVATPSFSPEAGIYDRTQSVSISCATPGATIHYTTDSSTPTSSSPIYSEVIMVYQTTTIKAIAFKEGLPDSDIASAIFSIIPAPQVATPRISPAGGTYYQTLSVFILCATPEATIRYTRNGSTPTSTSPIYSEPINVYQTSTIKAKAFRTGWTDSITASADYTITSVPPVATPSFSPAEGTYTQAQSVSIFCATPDATIRYTTDGSTPISSSPIYSEAINVSETTTIKAKAFKTDWPDSNMAKATYAIIWDISEMVYVPGGTFTMGDTRGAGYGDERPLHSVTLDPFYICKYQVTQAEFEDIMGYNRANEYGGLGSYHPVYNINWYESIVYCNLLSIREGLTPAYSISGSVDPNDWGEIPTDPTDDESNWWAVICDWEADGYRLPTEAEWEYAARGAANNPDYLFSGSENIDDVAWYIENTNGSIKPVGGKAANGLGIYDMSGNVYESCWDWYDSYGSAPSGNPTGPATGSRRVRRGGSGFNHFPACRVASRGFYYPISRVSFTGIRVCRTFR